MQHVWATYIAPDFALWQSTASGRQRPSQIQAGRAIHVMEAAQQANDMASLADVRCCSSCCSYCPAVVMSGLYLSISSWLVYEAGLSSGHVPCRCRGGC